MGHGMGCQIIQSRERQWTHANLDKADLEQFVEPAKDNVLVDVQLAQVGQEVVAALPETELVGQSVGCWKDSDLFGAGRTNPVPGTGM